MIDPRDLGFNTSEVTELAGGNPAENARIIEAVLGGQGPGGARAAVLLNAAAAIYGSGIVSTLPEAVAKAQEALDSGAGKLALGRLRDAYHVSS